MEPRTFSARPASQFLPVGILGVDGDVADALAGQRQVLGVGVDHHRVPIVGEYLGITKTVVDYAAVGLVAYDENLSAILGLLAGLSASIL